METKVPFYNIVNIFLPGLVFLGSCVFLFLDEVSALVQAVVNLGSTGFEVLVTVALFAIAYEIGYILFRIGTVAIEPLLKKIFGWAAYEDFLAAGKTGEKEYDKLDMHSREYGYALTHITLLIVLTILTGIRTQWWIMVGCIICVALFIFSVQSHMMQTQKAVKKYLSASSSESGGGND